MSINKRKLYEDDDDWERNGQEEMNELYEKCKQTRSVTLVDVCAIALTHTHWQEQKHVQDIVANVLCDYVGPQIEKAERELSKI